MEISFSLFTVRPKAEQLSLIIRTHQHTGHPHPVLVPATADIPANDFNDSSAPCLLTLRVSLRCISNGSVPRVCLKETLCEQVRYATDFHYAPVSSPPRATVG
jgi:hypothetical protein